MSCYCYYVQTLNNSYTTTRGKTVKKRQIPWAGEYATLKRRDPIAGEFNWKAKVALCQLKHCTLPFSLSATHTSSLSWTSVSAWGTLSWYTFGIISPIQTQYSTLYYISYFLYVSSLHHNFVKYCWFPAIYTFSSNEAFRCHNHYQVLPTTTLK